MSLTIATRILDDASVSTEIRAVSGLERIDYLDEFTARTQVVADPGRWARAMFGDEPSPAERFIWQTVLRLDLVAGRSSDRIAGWRVTGGGDGWIRMSTSSRDLAATLLVRIGDGVVSLTTLVRYENDRGRRLWTTLSPVHRLLVPKILASAATSLEREGQPNDYDQSDRRDQSGRDIEPAGDQEAVR